MNSPLRENMTRMVKRRAIRVMGLIFGMNFSSYHCLSLRFQADEPGKNTGNEGNSEIDENTLRNLANGDIDHHPFEPETSGEGP